MLSKALVDAKLNFWRDFASPWKPIINYLFLNDPGLIRVRKSIEVKTEINNVTTLDFIGLVERYNYSAEEHYVTTEDGYNLVIHRISGSPLIINNQRKKKVVFFQHGLFCSSDSWVTIGPNKDLAFLLADQGYDIWLGNIRGNSYCRSHVKLSPRDKKFWQFSFHELGTKDLSAMIDYVLNYTKQKTLHYVGHSMGTTALFILLSVKPEYNAKIKLGILLAPVAMWKEVSYAVHHIRNKIPKIKEFLDSNKIYEVLPLSSKSITMGRSLCANKAITQAFCASLMFLIFGSDPVLLNTTAFPEILSYFPAGASVQTLYHFYQNFVTHKFQSYDYKYVGNYKQYKQVTPIMYDLNKTVVPLCLFYGNNDLLAPKANVFETYRHLPNVILLKEVPYKFFNHMDFLWATNAKALLYNNVIQVINKY
ncbi:hypothetical protein PUN28_012380 [Cardiocondyla obscurior]